MGDRKPKKNSSGNADAHKAKGSKPATTPDATPSKDRDKKAGDKR